MSNQKLLSYKNNVSNSVFKPSQNNIPEKSFPKLNVSFQNRQYSLPINPDSTIKKLALELLVMLFDQIIDQQLNEDFRQLHSTICQILVKQVHSVISIEKNHKITAFLSKMVHQYQSQKTPNTNQPQSDSNRYFIKNYLNTLRESSTKKNANQTNQNSQRNVSTQNFKLYQKGRKSMQRKRKLQKENAEQKSKIQISYCTFAPNISKSQKKFTRKQTSSVFQRLYENAEEAKIKNFFKRKQMENEEQKVNSSFKFTPEINQCSKLIVNLRQRQQKNEKILLEQLHKSKTSFQTNQNSSQKYLNNHSSKKVFEKLYDISFYENRLNKTINKIEKDNKQNSFTYQPELSVGTKRITQHYPKLEKRMEIYNIKKSQHHRSTTDFSQGKDKSLKKIPSKNQFVHPMKIPDLQIKQKKGIRKMLDRIKTEPLQEISITSNSQSPGIGRYSSQIFQLQSDFVDDDSMFDITPKRLNLDPQKQKAFFKVKQTKIQKDFQKTPHRPKMDASHASMKQIQNKQQIFSRIFVYLSLDSDEITAKKIQSNRSLPSEIQQILRPLTEELSQMDTQLDEEEFVWSLENLYEQLELQRKAILLSWGLKLVKNISPRFSTYDKMRHVKTEGSVFELVD